MTKFGQSVRLGQNLAHAPHMGMVKLGQSVHTPIIVINESVFLPNMKNTVIDRGLKLNPTLAIPISVKCLGKERGLEFTRESRNRGEGYKFTK